MSLLLIGGSLRGGSGNAAVLQTVHELSPESTIYGGLGSLPHFNPDDDREPLDHAVAELRAGIKAAHALLFCTPEYAGGLPGSFKNLLDWTVGGGEIRKAGRVDQRVLGSVANRWRRRARVPAQGARLLGRGDRRGGLCADPYPT